MMERFRVLSEAASTHMGCHLMGCQIRSGARKEPRIVFLTFSRVVPKHSTLFDQIKCRFNGRLHDTHRTMCRAAWTAKVVWVAGYKVFAVMTSWHVGCCLFVTHVKEFASSSGILM